ncbi:hypothetical protein K8O68_12315 [Salipaludibacillus sp. CUR1]|uniref:hypothetical protein n=1 Tax=Salipaludibacillus sp. CUR1 TaxID=2820003 RepID=UPI001E639EDA|nr:hypothetical protein [Salipaludibacillus sp. CUR1]MCE7793202.1 hypothetical protein [Salipaludibacillus sp. CUR1]
MEKYTEVMKHSLQLTETMVEGLSHIQKQLSEGKYLEATQLLTDVISGYASIENSVRPVLIALEKEGQVEGHLDDVRKNMGQVVTLLEEEDFGTVQEVIQFTLLPNVKKLKEEMETVFKPYIVS